MKIKKIVSLMLSVMLVLTVVCGCFAVSANAEGQITYSYVIKTSEEVNAIDGRIHYPSSALRVNSITFDGTKNDNKNGTIKFNNSSVSDPYDFSQGAAVITVVFDVNGQYDSSQVYGEFIDFCNINTLDDSNIPFDYSNVIEGEVVSCGHTDIDNPANSYENTKYTISYSYQTNPAAENPTNYTKYAWSNLTDAKTIAELNMPRIENPYYKSYSVDTASFASAGSTVINAALSCEVRKYNVTLNGASAGQYEYLQPATVTASGDKYFLIDGACVAWGTSYTFFVTSNTDITTEDQGSGLDEKRASVITNALYLSDNDQNSANIKMEMLASATTDGFERMGIAFTSTQRGKEDLSAAINAITGTNTAVSNKIAVHNSKVDNPNVSGQYQYVYAPYVTVSKVSKDKVLYFYAFVVDSDGTVTISEPAQIKFADILT